VNEPFFPAQAAARADAEQRVASDPRVSAFVSASAGSGKTKLLTDRLLRLMLDGADPRRIQCLTFTRAAAAEMALRLQDRLGGWVTLGDAALGRALAGLGVLVDEARLRRARALFATVLDLPGGMRIGTIHAFCQSLLRRFPLEAGISPHFQLVEGGEARLMLEEAREAVLTAAPPGSVALIAEAQRAEGFGSLVADLDAKRDRMGWLLDLLPPQRRNALRRALGVSARSEAALLLDAVAWPGEAAMRGAVRLMLAHGSQAAKDRGAKMEAWLAATPAGRVEHWDWWQSALLTEKETPRAASVFAGKPLRERHPELVEAVEAEQERVRAVLDQRRAVQLVEASAALLDLAVPVLQRYAQRKREGGLLDYADMIGHTAMLLRDPGAAWVLYKLDGGLDHLLLDEVQDTSPEQWRIAHVLTEEFFAGMGRDEERPRTFFAVGDPKQSIYSFQGADPAEFGRSHAQMAQRVRDAGQAWRDVPLDVSFRSTAPVLALVDAVFADPFAAHGVVSPGAKPLEHFANRADAAGRVELWPLQPRPEARERAAWEVAERNEEQPSPEQALATELARWIKGQLDEGVLLPSQGRPLKAGDVLVLVQRRGTFAPALVRALKVAGVPVAGLDRLALREQLAVQDLLALCDALLLPGDDLQLACVLTSPLGGLSDDSLMELALGRPGSLWEALRTRAPERRVWADALRFLDALHARADFATPHALLSEALGPLGGRARLLRRLGPEAAEPMDELLTAALTYAGAHPPSLQGFVHWMRASSEEVKREPEGPGGLVRVMTVHGAKGLQARLVILPDTTGTKSRDDPFVWLRDPGGGGSVPVWVPRAAMRSERVDQALKLEADEDQAERNRLLYVALTRAQDQLVVCGWEPAKALAPESWHAMVRRGFERLDARAEPFTALAGNWAGERLVIESAQQARVEPADAPAREAEAPLPTWAGRAPDWRPVPLAPEPQPPHLIAASRPEGVEMGDVPRTASPLAARPGVDPFLHGRLVHALLQNLPELPPGERPEAARSYAGRSGFGLPRAEMRRVVEESLAVLADASLAPLFGPGSRAEQPLVGVVDGAVVSGVADRVAVLPGEVLVADYKTDRDPPDRAEDTPALYLGQLAAYQAVLAAAFPDRPVRCLLVWTRTGQVVAIPDALLAAHRPHARPAA
jgi:ATP-dependent helicase/nuclease subunit A